MTTAADSDPFGGSTPVPPPLDPEVGVVWRTISDEVFGGGGPLVDAETLEVARQFEMPGREALLTSRPFRHTDLTIPGPAGEMTLAVYTPHRHEAPSPAFLWVHGGGMVAGDRFGAAEALDVAEAVGAVVVSPEYRLAPEHPAPAPVDDCTAALAWLLENAAHVGADSSRVVLGGASAGGGIAAAVALRHRDASGAPLAGLMLSCPMLDDRMTSVSSGQFGNDVLWSRQSNEFGWHSLLGGRAGTDDVSVYEAPGRATDLAGLPPTLVDVGSADLFRDEDVAFASGIWASGGDAELHVWPGGYHGFELLVPTAVLSVDTVSTRRAWLRRTLAKTEAAAGA